jgi:signal transduction histidine kinase
MLDLLRLTPMTEIQSLYVTTMQTSAESLLGCLNDILDFSKVILHCFKISLLFVSVTQGVPQYQRWRGKVSKMVGIEGDLR